MKKLLVLVLSLCILFSGCECVTDKHSSLDWYKDRCGNVCPIGNADNYFDSGGADEWVCVCVNAWNKPYVVKYCKSTKDGWICGNIKSDCDVDYGDWND